jgi:hypothetical protein
MNERPPITELGEKPGPFREFLRPPTALEWLVIAGIILVIAVLLMPNIEMGSVEVEKMMKNAVSQAKP